MMVVTQLDEVRKEIRIMNKISHPNCIRLIEVIEDVPPKELANLNQVYELDDDQKFELQPFEEGESSDDSLSEKIYLVMELAEYRQVMTWNTHSFVFMPNPILLKTPQSKFISQKVILSIIRDVLSAVAYLHDQVGIVHRDIKPLNILLAKTSDSPYSAKICDFGVSEVLDTEKPLLSKTAGTYPFFPPECCDPHVAQFCGKKADVWAVGVTLYCMIFNQLPFWQDDFAENEFGILDFILRSEVTIPENTQRQIVKDSQLESEDQVTESMI